MFISSGMNGEVDIYSIESQTRVNPFFLSLHVFSKISEMEVLALAAEERRVIVSCDDLPLPPTRRITSRTFFGQL